jgi:hypothetical protein
VQCSRLVNIITAACTNDTVYVERIIVKIYDEWGLDIINIGSVAVIIVVSTFVGYQLSNVKASKVYTVAFGRLFK